MADELKRVGLIFTEKGAADFKKTLKEVNLEIDKNYNQFKLAQAQWNASTSSTQKLRQEQEYLKNAFEIQSDKVTVLKMQLAELEGAENKNTTAIKKKRNELLKAEIKLDNYKNRLEETQQKLHNFGKKLEEVGGKVEKVGGKIEKAGNKVSAFSVATGAALATSAKSAIDFEDAFTGVEKTVDGTEEQMANLKQGIRDMAKEIPSTTTEISAVAEAAGQLGIKTDDILSFTKTMIDLGNSTNISAEEAASFLAKFANITNMSAKDYDKLGSTIVALGNNFATTEADIVAMATRLAATGDLAGLSQSQILALATAMSSVGIEAEAGGSAMSKLLKKIQVAVETGGKDLKQFADVAGVSSKDFKKAFEKDAVNALSMFLSGLNDTERNGKSAIGVLDDMGITEVRLSNTILSLANSSGLMNDAVKLANDAWEDNTALASEANKRYGTIKSKVTVAINKFKDLSVTFGNKLLPVVDKGIKYIDKITKKVEGLNEGQVETILKIGGIVTATGPLLKIMGKFTSTGGKVIKGVGTFTQAIGVMKNGVASDSKEVNNLAGFLTKLTSPAGLATTAILAIASAAVYVKAKQKEATRETREWAEKMADAKKSLDDYNASIDETAQMNLAQIDSIKPLREELKTLVDENGKVKDSDKSRVDFILNQLNEALGTEYELNGNVIDSYKDLQKEIDKTIEKKQAEIILSAEEEKYKDAIQNREKATDDLSKAYDNLGMSIEDARKQQEELHKITDDFDLYTTNDGDFYKAGDGKEYSINEFNDLAIQRKNLDNLISAYDDAEYRVKTYVDEVEKYETDYANFADQKYGEITKTVVDNSEKWTDSSLAEIKKSISDTKTNLKKYSDLYKRNRR